MPQLLSQLSRWWNSRSAASRLFVFLLGSLALVLLLFVQWPAIGVEDEGLSGLLLVLVVNLNIVILCVLSFLIMRNVVKLFFDRRRRILGSKLRLRLLAAFVVITLVPIALLSAFASGLIRRAMDDWFSSNVEQAVTSAVEVGRLYFQLRREVVEDKARALRTRISQSPILLRRPERTAAFLERERKRSDVYAIRILRSANETWAGATHPMAGLDTFGEPPTDKLAFQRALRGETVGLFEERGGGQFVRVYAPMKVRERSMVLSISYRFSPEMAHALRSVNDSYREYEQLKLFRNPLRSGYLLTLAMIAVLILFSAVWFAFYLARQLTIPLHRLAEGIRRVAQGQLDVQIEAGGDDELGSLVDSFNRMTTDLQASRAELDKRRLEMETILRNLGVGVVALDTDMRVTTVNPAARKIFRFPDTVEGLPLNELLGSATTKELEPLLNMHGVDAVGGVREVEVALLHGSDVRRVVCTLGQLREAEQKRLGFVLIADDVTDLTKAQQAAAWREVARRIAHEIKNPLTPIQISAQRLERLTAAQTGAAEVRECVQTIVEHVASIKRLANEFSRFARMPVVEHEPADLNAIISDLFSMYAEAHPDVHFQFIAEPALPQILVDREQMRRLVINLLENAVSAVREACPDGERRISLRTRSDAANGEVVLDISDNGRGVPEAYREKIFEPYFTTREGGSGLGLAIVQTIVFDHHGRIAVSDGNPRGAQFSVSLPVTPPVVTQRRLAG